MVVRSGDEGITALLEAAKKHEGLASLRFGRQNARCGAETQALLLSTMKQLKFCSIDPGYHGEDFKRKQERVEEENRFAQFQHCTPDALRPFVRPCLT